MKAISLLTAGALALSSVAGAANTAAPASFDGAQKTQIEQIVRSYLVSNPEVLLEASQALQAKQQETMQKQAKSAISEHANELLQGGITVAGNPKGSVTLIEFFDYQCGHCKKMEPVIDALIAKNKDLRVVYKEFPIFGKTSEVASQAAIAAAMQGKYIPMQAALLKQTKALDEATVMEAAKSVGLDIAQLKKDMGSKSVEEMLAKNRQLAEKMHLMGTPAFVVAATPMGAFKSGQEPDFIPGGTTEVALQALIKKASS